MYNTRRVQNQPDALPPPRNRQIRDMLINLRDFAEGQVENDIEGEIDYRRQLRMLREIQDSRRDNNQQNVDQIFRQAYQEFVNQRPTFSDRVQRSCGNNERGFY